MALLALEVMGMELTIAALIGIILLIGISLMIDFAIDAERTERLAPGGGDPHAAVLRYTRP